MEEKIIETISEKDGVSEKEATTKITDSVDTLTMTQADYDKAIQSAEDKVRGKMAKEIRELKDRVKELTPVEKTQAEIDFENRIKALEESEKLVADRERRVAVQEKLSGNGLDKSLADYLKDDADIDSVAALVNGMLSSRMASSGYVPKNHSSDEQISIEDYHKMSYMEKVEFSKRHPETYKRFTGRK